LKQGPFVLVTECEALLADAPWGVIKPNDLNANMFGSVKAVLIHDGLDQGRRSEIEAACVTRGLPFFHYSEPGAAEEYSQRGRATRDAALGFLRDQNAWRTPSPSQGTLERIELQALVDIITTANSLLQPSEVMNTVMIRIHQLIPCEAWSVLILNEEEDRTLSFAAAHGPGKEQLRHLKVPYGQGIAGWVAKHRQPIIVNNAQNDPRFLDQIDKNTRFVTKNILCAPLVSRGRIIGVIEMLNTGNPGGFSDEDLELLQTLVNPAAVAIENAYLFQKAQTLTIQDDLTKLYNSRHLNHCLETELKRAKRTGNPLSLIFLDLDGFKAINDNFGHLQGSECLVRIAQIIYECARETDVVGRYGGDEFVLILPDTDTHGAVIVAERVRDQIATYRPEGIRLTASIGVASYPNHGETKEMLFRLADKAMYRVKEQGKNGILLAHDLTE
jgi:diguanylate cyclase (GGDEF)-like protein